MLPFDDDDDGDFDIGESTQAERDLAPDSPGEALEEKYAEPDESELMGDVSDVDEDTFTAFVASAVLTNVAIFAVSLGLLLWYFRGMQQVGGGLVVLGILAQLRMYQYYREWKQSRRDEEPESAETGAEAAKGGSTTDHADADDSNETDGP